jgi:hypothetical protein
VKAWTGLNWLRKYSSGGIFWVWYGSFGLLHGHLRYHQLLKELPIDRASLWFNTSKPRAHHSTRFFTPIQIFENNFFSLARTHAHTHISSCSLWCYIHQLFIFRSNIFWCSCITDCLREEGESQMSVDCAMHKLCTWIITSWNRTAFVSEKREPILFWNGTGHK